MPAIGQVTKQKDGNFKGQLKTLSIKAPIDILLNPSKSGDTQPDYRVYSAGVEIGGGWIRKGQTSGEKYVSLTLADPTFGPKKLYANLGRAAGQDAEDVFAIIWNTLD
jgi:uncharacterized protein (DUF736 family)